jgi:hypothetical protein
MDLQLIGKVAVVTGASPELTELAAAAVHPGPVRETPVEQTGIQPGLGGFPGSSLSILVDSGEIRKRPGG